MAAYLESSGDAAGSAKATPSGAAGGFGPIRTGRAMPSRTSRAAASSTLGSFPSGNAMIFLSLRARSMSAAMNSRADSGIAAMNSRG